MTRFIDCVNPQTGATARLPESALRSWGRRNGWVPVDAEPEAETDTTPTDQDPASAGEPKE